MWKVGIFENSIFWCLIVDFKVEKFDLKLQVFVGNEKGPFRSVEHQDGVVKGVASQYKAYPNLRQAFFFCWLPKPQQTTTELFTLIFQFVQHNKTEIFFFSPPWILCKIQFSDGWGGASAGKRHTSKWKLRFFQRGFIQRGGCFFKSKRSIMENCSKASQASWDTVKCEKVLI